MSAPERSKVLASLIRQTCGEPIAGAEVGVQKGETSAYLLQTFPGLALWMIDRWDPEPFKLGRNKFSQMAKFHDQPQVFAGWEREARAAVAFAGDRARIVKEDFVDAAEQILHCVDFVFLDAAHSYQDTMRQIILYSPKVRSGGLVAVHDYEYQAPGYHVVKEAVDDFISFTGVTLRVAQPSTIAYWINP